MIWRVIGLLIGKARKRGVEDHIYIREMKKTVEEAWREFIEA